MSDQNFNEQLKEMQQRIDLLERDNQRLREKMEPILGPDNPWFNPKQFIRALQRILSTLMIPFLAMQLLVPLLIVKPGKLPIPRMRLGPIPVFDMAGVGTRHPGIGVGIVAVGGVGVGVIAIGGLGVGIVALGGGAIGVFAFGGGSIGLIALGGGALGYIAIGGGAAGYYALGNRAYGKFVLALNRQDQQAIDFFTRYFPSLRAAVTTPMPVIQIQNKSP